MLNMVGYAGGISIENSCVTGMTVSNGNENVYLSITMF